MSINYLPLGHYMASTDITVHVINHKSYIECRTTLNDHIGTSSKLRPRSGNVADLRCQPRPFWNCSKSTSQGRPPPYHGYR